MRTLAILGLPSGGEVILVIFIILLLFGAKKLPELSRSLGKSLGEFKKGQKEGNATDNKVSEISSESDEIENKESPLE